ncbi:hypothetical protein IC582_003974 [Cucumis melo]
MFPSHNGSPNLTLFLKVSTSPNITLPFNIDFLLGSSSVAGFTSGRFQVSKDFSL